MSLRYKNPPITEAIVDLRVEPRPGASAVEIATGLEKNIGFSEMFPVRQEIPARSGFENPFGELRASYVTGGIVLGGFRYESADRRIIMQVRRDAFVFSLLPPYQNWEHFSGTVKPLWKSYCKVWRPRLITRVALRYVNRLVYTYADFENAEAASLLPELPRPTLLPDKVFSGCSVQMALPQPDIQCDAFINYSLTPAEGNLIPATLDIDVFEEDLAWDALGNQSASKLWKKLAQMRTRKNDLFRACLTESMEQRLEPQE